MTDQWVIGCADDCDLVITGDPYVSAHHAVVKADDEGVLTVADLGSTNGTWIDFGDLDVKTRVERPTRLRFGDTIWVGRTAIPWRKT